MSKQYSGLKAVAFSSTGVFGGEETTITGPIAADSTLEPSTITVDTTQSTVFGGEQLEMTVGVLNFSNYAALKTAMLADTEYYWQFTFVDDVTQTTSDAFPFQVVKVLSPDKRTGLNRYNITGFVALADETLTTG